MATATDILEEDYIKVKEENDRYRQLNSQLKDRLVALDAQIAATECRIQQKLIVPGGIFKKQRKHQQDWKCICILEDKLYQDTIKFNEIMCRNAALREHIAHLQQQKGVGCNIQAKLNRELAKQRSILEELYQRSKAQTHLPEATQSMEGEALDFINRRTQLKSAIYYDAKLQTFMKKKLQKSVPLEEDEDSKKRTNLKQNQNDVEMLKMHQHAHSPLFVQNKEKNISYINYINKQDNRLNMLRRAINKRKSDILFIEQEIERREEQDAHELQELESELEKYRCLADSLEEQSAVVEETLDQLKTGIASFYAEIMQIPITVTSDNVVNILAVLEERIIDLLIKANCRRYNETEFTAQILPLASYDLLPDVGAAEEKESRKSRPSSVKFSLSDGK